MQRINLLLVEDNEGDIFLIQDNLQNMAIEWNIIVKKNGGSAVDYLMECVESKTCVLPDLIFLDINLPVLNGHEVLAFIKSNSKTKKIPTVILSTSSSFADIDRAYENYANSYITKPSSFDDFLGVIDQLSQYWIDTATLPGDN